MQVDLETLRKLPDQLDRLAEDAKHTKAYVTDGIDERLGQGEPGIINMIAGGHSQARTEVEGFLEKLSTKTAPAYSTAVADTITHYEITDEATASDIDNSITVEQSDLDSVDSGLSSLYQAPNLPSMFDDRKEPTDALSKVGDYNASPDYGGSYGWNDVLSPSAAVVEIVRGVTEVGVMLGILDREYIITDEFVRPLTGDWGGVRACADYYENAARSLDSMAANLNWATYSTKSCWEANASDACQVSLTQLKEVLIVAAGLIRPLSTEYISSAKEIDHTRGIVAGLVGELIDACILASASAAAAIASAKTVVGGILFGGFAAVELYFIADIIKSLYDILAKAKTYVESAAGAMEGFGIIDYGGDLPELPAPPPVPQV